MNTGELQIQRRTLGDVAILDCAGRIVRIESDVFLDAVAFAIERSRSVLLNFAAVTAIDSNGLEMLFLVKRLSDAASCELSVCSANARVSKMLHLARLNTLLTIYRTEDDALRDVIDEIVKAPPPPKSARKTAPDNSAARSAGAPGSRS